MEWERRIRWLRRLGVLLVVWTIGLIALGGWVKATGSGLACPDWPQCYGQWLPPFPSADNGGLDEDGAPVMYSQAQVLYEWMHRLVASLLGIPFLAFVVIALGGRDLDPALRWLPVAAGVILTIQVLLGGGTVLKGNPAYLTTMHLVTATLFFGCVLVATCFAFLRPTPPSISQPTTATEAQHAHGTPASAPTSPGRRRTSSSQPSVRHPGEPEA